MPAKNNEHNLCMWGSLVRIKVFTILYSLHSMHSWSLTCTSKTVCLKCSITDTHKPVHITQVIDEHSWLSVFQCTSGSDFHSFTCLLKTGSVVDLPANCVDVNQPGQQPAGGKNQSMLAGGNSVHLSMHCLWDIVITTLSCSFCLLVNLHAG